MNKGTTGLIIAGVAILGGWCLYKSWQARQGKNGNSNFVDDYNYYSRFPSQPKDVGTSEARKVNYMLGTGLL